MGFFFRKTKRLGASANLTISKKGPSVSVGPVVGRLWASRAEGPPILGATGPSSAGMQVGPSLRKGSHDESNRPA